MEVVRIDTSIVLIPLFRVDVPASSEGIRLSSEASRAETNDEVELGEELQPAGLLLSQKLGGCEVFQVLMVSDDVNQNCRAFKIVAPGPKSLVDSEELLVMGVIVKLWSRQSPGIVGNRPNLLVRTTNGENASNGIVGGVCLYDDGSVWNPMGEDRSGGEGVFEVLEGGVTGVTEVLGNTFSDKAGQRSDDARVVIYELPVEIRKAEEGLHVLDLPRLGPVLYGLHLLQRHSKSGG